jgi:hypothetical protein
MVAVAVEGGGVLGVGLSLLNGYGAHRFDAHMHLHFWTLQQVITSIGAFGSES